MLQHSRANTGKKELSDINALADEYLRLSYHGLRAKDKDFNADFKTTFGENIGKVEVVQQDNKAKRFHNRLQFLRVMINSAYSPSLVSTFNSPPCTLV